MIVEKNFLFNLLPSFQNKEEFFDKILQDDKPIKKILILYLFFNLLFFIYGMVMGCYHSFLQAIVTGGKIVFLFSAVLLICFPAFFIVQFLLGSKLKLFQMVSIIFSGFLLCSVIMVSFSPITLFFLITGNNYYFLQLLHIVVFLFSGFFAMKIIVDGLKYSCEKKNIYPKTGVIIFRFWVVIFAFVFIQLAWNLRPFMGDRGDDFSLFGKYKGNFYSAVIYSVKQLVIQDINQIDQRDQENQNEDLEIDLNSIFTGDTIDY